MNILVTGNTSYLTREFIQEAFPEGRVIILGPCDLKTSYRQGVTVLSMEQRDWALEEVCEMYEINQVVFFSNFLTLRSQEVGEGEALQQLLTACQSYRISRFCYLSGPQSGYQNQQLETQLAQSYEQLCLYEGKEHGMSIKVIQIRLYRLISIRYLASGRLEKQHASRRIVTVTFSSYRWMI